MTVQTQTETNQKYTLVTLVDNRPGVLNRIASLFRPTQLQHRQPYRGAHPQTAHLQDDYRC